MPPQTKTCRLSGKQFMVTDADQAYYQRLGVSLPTLSPLERQRRRLSWRNERTLYTRTCDATGATIMSIHSQDRPFPVYENDYWWSDAWDPIDYGQDYDFNRSFFEQFNELQNRVPQFALSVVKPTLENADYCNQVGYLKDCYLLFDSRHSEKCMYSKSLEDCYECFDCLKVFDSELCYECNFCFNCYSCAYLFDSQNCNECFYGRDLIGCKYCFGCTNLRNKEFYFFNQAMGSKEAWEKAVADFRSKHSPEELLATFLNFSAGQPIKWMSEIGTENCTGDYMISSKDCVECYDSVNMENCSYCYDIKRTRGGSPNFANYDVAHFGGTLTECYECCSIGNSGVNRLMFCENVWASANSYYSRNCNQVQDLFGCVGMRNSRYCILNKQYTEAEYKDLLPRIIAQMQQLSEWGEFFPTRYSVYGYNETLAQEYFPITKEDAQRLGWKWTELPKKPVSTGAMTTDTFDRTVLDDAVLTRTFVCKESDQPFKVTKLELEFYRKLKLPLPLYCFEERHMRRMKLKKPRFLAERTCADCGVSLRTGEWDMQKQVFCHQCYLQRVD